MEKAEERALEAYPKEDDSWVETNVDRRIGYKQGYNQAMKDLTLTWRDMAEVVKIAGLLEMEWLRNTPWDGIRDSHFYEEVLKRFNERRNG